MLTNQCLRLSQIVMKEATSSTASGKWTAHNAVMATKSRTAAPAIGSMPWLDQENQQAAQFAAQEAEDFAFSVRNELDFLNEHMAEIFSKNQVYDFSFEFVGRTDVCQKHH